MHLTSMQYLVALVTVFSLFQLGLAAGIPPTTAVDLHPRADGTITKTKTIAKTTKTVTKTKTKTKTLTKVTVTKTATKTLPKATTTRTAIVTKPATTVIRTTTLPVSVRTTTTTATTVRSTTLPATTVTETTTVSVLPKENVPNANFEQQPDPAGWCKGNKDGICSIVDEASDGSFSGVAGPNMLRITIGPTASFSDFYIPVSIVSTPNPAGRNWTLTARYRSLAGNPGNCLPILGWADRKSGWGYGSQPGLVDDKSWNYVRREIPGSAKGVDGDWQIYVIAWCVLRGTGDALYVDSVVVD